MTYPPAADFGPGSAKKGNRHDVEVFAQLPGWLGAIFRVNPPLKGGISAKTTSHWHDVRFFTQ
jgi:hypothetical protein